MNLIKWIRRIVSRNKKQKGAPNQADEIYEVGVDSNNEGWKALQNGDLNRAITLFRRSIEMCQIIDDYEGEKTALSNLAETLFKKWAEQRSLVTNLNEELEDGLLAEGLECHFKAIKTCITHNDLKGAGGIVNDVSIRLGRVAGLNVTDELVCIAFFHKKYIVPLMRENNIRELPGLSGLPAITLYGK